MKAVGVFKEDMVSIDFDDPRDFTDVASRRTRYAIYWAMYENSAYRNIHAWGQSYRRQYGLYKYIRNVYNPSYALGNFWRTYLLGGQLDPAAGDGEETPSALPIIIPESNQANADRLRQAIATLWRDSNWQIEKDIVSMWGAVMGDAALMVVDDPGKSNVYLEKVHPSDLYDVTKDHRGNVKSYVIERKIVHPVNRSDAVYREECANDGGKIIYKTYLDGTPYDYTGETGAEWDEDYGFIPLVLIQHDNVGLDWGWSEIHPQRSKTHEADDIASAVSDHIRKSVNSPYLMAGVPNPALSPSKITIAPTAPTVSRPEAGREETPFIYANDPAAHADKLLSDMDYEGALAHLNGIVNQIEREYPELRFDNMRITGDASGRALRIARQPAEAKVRARRANYDDAITRAQMMALTIGGMKGYPGYEGFGAESYGRGELDHRIGDRPVFGTDSLEQAEEETLFWQNAQAATNAGVPLEGYLRSKGWTDEKIQELLYSGVEEQ